MTRSSDPSPLIGAGEVAEAVRSFAAERRWDRYHDPKNLTMALASEVGELSALLRWVDNGNSDAAVRDDAVLRNKVIHEIGDVAILLLLLCDRVGVRFEEAVMEKLARNAANYPVSTSAGRPERPSEGML